VRLVIGLIHFLYFIIPTYFDSEGTFLPLPSDYQSALYSIGEIVSAKMKYGLFYYEPVNWKHAHILNFMSYPFLFFGPYALNITPFNSYMSIITSINILLISKHVFTYPLRQLKFVAIITAYFPLTLISSLFYRDITGIALISTGLVLIMFSPKGMIRYLMLLPALYLFYIHRTIYPLVLIMSYMVDYFIRTKNSLGSIQKKQIIPFFIFVFVSIFILRWTIIFGLVKGGNQGYIDAAGGVNYLFLPLKLVMGIIGPFPWSQYFTTGRIEYSYQFADYLQGAFNVALVTSMILLYRSFFKWNHFNLLNLTGLFLATIGLATTYMHTSYVSIGIIFLAPWISNSVVIHQFKRYYMLSFILLLLFSIFITLTGNLGLGRLWY